MNVRRGQLNFKNFQILLDSICSSTIVMGGLVEKLCLEKDSMMQCHTQARKITTNLKVKVEFNLHALSATHAVMWKFYVGDSAKGRYNMILERDLLT